MVKNPIMSNPKDPPGLKAPGCRAFPCIVTAVLILADFGRLFWHFGYFFFQCDSENMNF